VWRCIVARADHCGTSAKASGEILSQVSPLSGARGVQALFFTYFGFVGIFSPYLSLYFAHTGMTVAQIGVLMSLPQVLRIIGPPFWGWLADHSLSRLSILRFSAAATLALVCLFPWVIGFGYWAMMPYLVALFFMTAAQTPINEAMAVQIADGDQGRYGNMRLWGSIGFILTVSTMGPLLDWVGLNSLPYWMALGALGMVWASFSRLNVDVSAKPQKLAQTQDPNAATSLSSLGGTAADSDLGLGAQTSGQAGRDRVRTRLMQPEIAWFFVANGLMVFSHAALYVLFSLYLESNGYTKTDVGLVWAISVIAEIILFRYQKRIFERFDLMLLLALSLLTAALRFGAVGLLAPTVLLLVVTQISHAITFGLHHSAAMGLLHRWFEPKQQGRAQAIYIVSSYGLGGSIGGLVCSQLWVHFYPAAAFLGAALAALLGTISALVSWHYARRRTS
jgi:MFS transporter, PPP family, 3-phenylpropionic acid transporter